MKNSYSSRFLALTGLFVAALIISNVIAGRLMDLFGVVLPSAVILFPLTYILGDLFAEVYGLKAARLVIWIGLGANGLLALVSLAVTWLPAPGFFAQGAQAYQTVLGQTPRVILGSLAAWWAGEWVNASVLVWLKTLTQGRFLWVRTLGSSVLGQGVDTALFILIAFAGLVPTPVLLGMLAAQYLFKLAYEALCTPLTYAAVRWLKAQESQA